MSDELFKNKYLKYKEKYNKLQNYYNLFKDNYQTAGNMNRTNEYCYLTGKKFEENDFVSQCKECKNWGLVSEIIKSNNCKYCNSNLNNKFSLTQNDINNIMELVEDNEKDIVDIGFQDLKFNIDDNDYTETIETYNKRLLGNDDLFNKSYHNYINSNNPELRQLLLDNLHILIEQIVPDDFLGTYTYHNNNHNHNNTDEDNCLYCIYNNIL